MYQIDVPNCDYEVKRYHMRKLIMVDILCPLIIRCFNKWLTCDEIAVQINIW